MAMYRRRADGPRTVNNTNVNLLVALDALLRERSVTNAARDAGVTQSSMSGVLAQLRELFGDPILVRSGRSMQPTPFAAALRQTLRQSIALLGEVLRGGSEFEPASSRERFVLALGDRNESVLFPQLLETMRRVAPSVTVQVVPWGLMGPPPGLASGEVDVSIGVVPPFELRETLTVPFVLAPGHRSERLYDAGLTSIVRADHPRVGKRLTLKTYCELDHLLVTEQPGGLGVVDLLLARMGKKRKVAVRVPRHTLVPELIARTDLVATIDRRIAHAQAKRLGLRLHKPPLQILAADISMMWHERTHVDTGRSWLREQIRSVAHAGRRLGAL